MTYSELKRWLEKQGCCFIENRGKGSHVTVILGDKRSILPMHGKKEVPTGTLYAIKKQLGLK